MPTLRQLQYLVALHQTGHFRLAAEKSGVSQPTLSAQIQSLEQRLGVQLVERNRSPVILTTAGERIIGLARNVCTTVQEIHDTCRYYRHGPAGMVRLGVPASIGPYLLPTVLPSLHASYPQLRLHVREGIPHALPDGLAAGTYDLLMMPLPVRGDDFTTRRLFREPLVLAVATDHRLANMDSVDLSELRNEQVLTLEKGHALNEQARDICDACGAELLQDYEGTSLDTLHHMVIMGLGIAFLPALYVKSGVNAVDGLKLLTIRSKPLTRTIGLVWRNSSADSETYQRIADHIVTTVRQNHPGFTVLDAPQ